MSLEFRRESLRKSLRIGEYWRRNWKWATFVLVAIVLACCYCYYFIVDAPKGDSHRISFIKDLIAYLIALEAFILAFHRARIADDHSEHSLHNNYLSLYQISNSMLRDEQTKLSGTQFLIDLAKSAEIQSKFIYHINVMRLLSEFVCDVPREGATDIGRKAKEKALEFLTSEEWRMNPVIQKIEKDEGYQVTLDEADLTRVDISKAFLERASLKKSTLKDAVLFHANLGQTDFSNANLVRADLGEANLGEANLLGANLGGSVLVGADLGGANLGGTNLERANLEQAILGGANLDRANLKRANLGGANLTGANLAGADLLGANLTGANFRGAKGLDEIFSYQGIWASSGYEPEGLTDKFMEEVKKNKKPFS